MLLSLSENNEGVKTLPFVSSVIFVHNYPSGDPEPSGDDIKLTARLVQAGEIMGINLSDHVIIGDKNYLSLKSKGLF